MKLRDLVTGYMECMDYDLVLSSFTVLVDEYTAILDCPIVAIVASADDQEIRFCVDEESAEMTRRSQKGKKQP